MHVYVNCKLTLVSILVNGLNDVTHVHDLVNSVEKFQIHVYLLEIYT